MEPDPRTTRNSSFPAGKRLNRPAVTMRIKLSAVCTSAPCTWRGSPKSAAGEGKVSAVQAGEQLLPCEGVFFLRSAVSPTQLLPELELEGPYIRVDRNMATNLPGVFAAGDCTGLPLQISKAVGEGLVAGLRAAEYLDRRSNP